VTVRVEIHLDETKLDAAVVPPARRKLASIQRLGANQARQDVPVRTGNLGRRIKEGEIKLVGPRLLHGSVGDDAHYAAAVHEGSRPHIIRPRPGTRALRFVVGGRVVFAQFVNHPGTRSRPFLSNAMMRVAAQQVAG